MNLQYLFIMAGKSGLIIILGVLTIAALAGAIAVTVLV